MSAKINYEALAADYWENLATTLRGFSPSAEFEFLETWVHDENNAQSILNLVEAAKDAGLPGVSVEVGARTLETLAPDTLAEELAQVGDVQAWESDEGIVFEVSF